MNNHEKIYIAPKISKLGNLTELTQGGSGPYLDGNSGMVGNFGGGVGGGMNMMMMM